MGRAAKDLTGQRFGSLTVTARAGSNKHQLAVWSCLCDCGNTTVTAGSDLRRGNTSSCGCKRALLDLTGQRFGRLVVCGLLGKDNGRNVWHVKCDCGQEKMLESRHLNQVRSCGCSKYKEITGERFGKLTALKRLGTTTNDKSLWLCRCDCGMETRVTLNSLKSGKTKSCGCLAMPHGCSDTPEYSIYQYKICAEQSLFASWQEFFDTVGARPSERHQLARRDYTKPHSPTNTYWRNASDYTDLAATDLGSEFVLDLRSLCLAEAAAREGEASA